MLFLLKEIVNGTIFDVQAEADHRVDILSQADVTSGKGTDDDTDTAKISQ